MRNTAASVLVACCFLTACGANDADNKASTLTLPPTATSSTSESPSPTTAAAPSQNERNNIVKRLGEIASLVTVNGDHMVDFSVDSIEVDLPCNGDRPEPAENGHLLVLSMRVTTGDLSELGGDFSINPYDWQAIGADGLTETNLATAATYSCLTQAEQLPTTMGPGQQFVGKLVLDTRNASGSVIFAPGYVEGGWEWVY